MGKPIALGRWRRCAIALLALMTATASLALTAAPADALVSSTSSTMAMANGNVTSIAQAAGRIFIGGTFTAAGDSPATYVARSNFAAINAATGHFDPSFNVAVDGEILAMAPTADGTEVILAGSFRTVGGVRRLKLAKVNATTGAVSPWNPTAGAAVRALAVSGNRLYVAGGFTTVGGRPAQYLAALDLATGAVDPLWRPSPDRAPRAIELSADGSTLFVGGAFSSIGGQALRNLAQVSAWGSGRSDEHTSVLQSPCNFVCRLML